MFKKNLLVIPALIAAYFIYQFVFIGSDEKQIKSLFKEIKNIVKIDGTLKKGQILSRTLKLKELIAKDVEISAFEGERILFDSEGFDSIQGGAFVGAKYLSEHSVILQDFAIDINNNQASADVVVVSNGETIESDQFRELFSAKVKLKKIDEQWVIVQVDAERMTADYD